MKAVVYLLIISAIIGAGYKAFAFTYGKGVADTELAYAEELDDIREKAAKDAVDDYKLSQEIAGEETDIEIQIVETIREIEVEVETIIEKIVEVKPECSDLPELGELFSQQAEAANQRSSSLTADTR